MRTRAFQTFRESFVERRFVKTAPESPREPSLIREVDTWIEKLHLGWTSVDLQCIRPLILAEILEPLDIVPQPLFLSAVRCQAVRAGDMNLLTWVSNDGGKIEENGAVLRGADDDVVIGFANMAMNHGLYEWEITVEMPCKRFWIQLVELAELEKDEASLSSQSGVLHRCGTRKHVISCKMFGGIVAKVRVHLDMKLRTCAFTIDGEKVDESWSILPHEVYHAVMMQKPGRVRIELISDADFI